MAKKFMKKEECCNVNINKKNSCAACGGGAYFLGFLGAAIYYLQTATGFWNGVLGLLKALVWPVFLVYELLKYLAISGVGI